YLANELICCISEELELERDINAFSQVNRRLYRLLNTYLYRRNVQHSGSSALLWAAQHGRDETARWLLGEIAGDQATSDCCITSLCVAAKEGHKEIVKLLLNKGTDVNSTHVAAKDGIEKRSNALYAASKRGHEQIVKLLLDNGANVNKQYIYYDSNREETYASNVLDAALEQGESRSNALYVASDRGHEQIVKLLLDNDANVNEPSIFYDGRDEEHFASYALDAASEDGHEQIVKLLLDKGANVNAQGGHYGNALQTASEGGHEQVVRLLLERGANVNGKGQYYYRWEYRFYDSTALCAASEGGHEQVVKILLDKGADVNAQGGQWGNALQAASQEGHEQI
ncbi:ankyrin, partial [Pleomassaria siparia CBS 279.74]